MRCSELKKKEKVIIFGNMSFAKLVHYFLKHDSKYEVVAFTVDRQYIKGDSFDGLPIYDFATIEEKYSPQEYQMFIAVGYNKLNQIRAAKYEAAKEKGYSLISYVHSGAHIWENNSIGENCFIMEKALLQPFVKLGNGVIVWSGAHITHDTKIGDYSFISSNCVIAGNVTVGRYCFAGVNSTFKDGITIGDSCLIGAGALMLGDASANGVYVAAGTERASFSSRLAKNFL